MQCPDCSAEAPEDDLFCESCGRRLADAPPNPAACPCGASEVDEDGFCLRCGRKLRRPASDRIEESLGRDVAAVSDRGIRHDRNEDRFALGQTGSACVLVVCDGVSTSHASEQASEAVSQTVRDVLVNTLRLGNVSDPETLMRKAIAAGAAGLAGRNRLHADENPPSTTVVAALVREGIATVGWVGDSRAYWIGPGGCRQLTRDHSWIESAVASGEMTAEQAARSPEAHAITRWIGADSSDPAPADVAGFSISEPGTLMLCTDGLWNYAPTPPEIAERFHAAWASEPNTLDAARHLVAFANACGGQDNITVALLRFASPPDNGETEDHARRRVTPTTQTGPIPSGLPAASSQEPGRETSALRETLSGRISQTETQTPTLAAPWGGSAGLQPHEPTPL